jgi:hypothetical protein
MAVLLGGYSKRKNKKYDFTYSKNKDGNWYFRGFDNEGFPLNIVFGGGQSFDKAKKIYRRFQKD